MSALFLIVPAKQSTCWLLVIGEPRKPPVNETVAKTEEKTVGVFPGSDPPEAVPVNVDPQGALFTYTPHWTALVAATEALRDPVDKHEAVQVHRTAPDTSAFCWKQVAWLPPQLMLARTLVAHWLCAYMLWADRQTAAANRNFLSTVITVVFS